MTRTKRRKANELDQIKINIGKIANILLHTMKFYHPTYKNDPYYDVLFNIEKWAEGQK